ncbi:MAG: sulfotransferase family protein, partial [Longimicrobiales bacterium]
MAHPAEAPRKVFIVGCPRSGTTWLQLLLSKHPQVATAPETQIVAFYLVHFLKQWEHEHNGPTAKHQGRAGLSRVLSEDEFHGLCRDVILCVLEKIAAQTPGATHVVEKSPGHAVHAQWIHRLLPDARFLHVVRDPRDTVASLLAASRTWGGDWAPHNPIDAARLWRRHVSEARGIARDSPQAYREVRYESLRAQPVDELASVACWLGLAWPRADCEAAVAACELDKLNKQK